jgi:V/A-type H+-transporting ATPase subunit E
MALEDILDAIRSEAEDEASRILGDATERAESVLAEARTASASREEELAHSADERIARERRRTVSLAVLEASRARRDAREEVFEAVIGKVSGVLRSLSDGEEYDDILERLLDEALAVLPDPERVEVHPADRERIERILAERGLAPSIDTTEDVWGGVGIRTDGRIVRNDLETRLRRAEPHLRFIAGEVFPSLRAGAE